MNNNNVATERQQQPVLWLAIICAIVAIFMGMVMIMSIEGYGTDTGFFYFTEAASIYEGYPSMGFLAFLTDMLNLVPMIVLGIGLILFVFGKIDNMKMTINISLVCMVLNYIYYLNYAALLSDSVWEIILGVFYYAAFCISVKLMHYAASKGKMTTFAPAVCIGGIMVCLTVLLFILSVAPLGMSYDSYAVRFVSIFVQMLCMLISYLLIIVYVQQSYNPALADGSIAEKGAVSVQPAVVSQSVSVQPVVAVQETVPPAPVKEPSSDEAVAKLEKLSQLKEAGIISAEDFEEKKKKYIDML